MGKIPVRICENSKLAWLASRKLKSRSVAIVFGRTIHLWGTTTQNFLANKAWLTHELQHVAQYRRYGFFGFLLRYAYYSLKVGYRRNPLEVEARMGEGNEELLLQYQIILPKKVLL